jgi:hypothetical protein
MCFLERFDKFINKTDGCWNWTSATNGTYGIFWLNQKQILAHRLSYSVHNNIVLAPSLVIRHKCSNKLCVNPNHLETGTLKDNSLDRWRDGTMNNKLTSEQVILIRTSEESLHALANFYGVHKSTISKIKSKKTWSHL